MPHVDSGATRIVRQGKPSRVSEKVEQAAIVELLRTIGAQVYVLGTVRRKGDHPGTMQTPGLPDVLAFLPPRWWEPSKAFLRGTIAIEVKAKGGRLREAQKEFRAACESSPVAYVTGGLDVVIWWLESRGYLKPNGAALTVISEALK